MWFCPIAMNDEPHPNWSGRPHAPHIQYTRPAAPFLPSSTFSTSIFVQSTAERTSRPGPTSCHCRRAALPPFLPPRNRQMISSASKRKNQPPAMSGPSPLISGRTPHAPRPSRAWISYNGGSWPSWSTRGSIWPWRSTLPLGPRLLQRALGRDDLVVDLPCKAGCAVKNATPVVSRLLRCEPEPPDVPQLARDPSERRGVVGDGLRDEVRVGHRLGVGQVVDGHELRLCGSDVEGLCLALLELRPPPLAPSNPDESDPSLAGKKQSGQAAAGRGVSDSNSMHGHRKVGIKMSRLHIRQKWGCASPPPDGGFFSSLLDGSVLGE